MRKFLEKNRRRIRQELSDAKDIMYFTPAALTEKTMTAKALSIYAHGKLIDIGCGNMPFKELVMDKVTQYDTFDAEKRVPNVKFIGDIQKMDAIVDSSYDCALCLGVLEHVQNPFKAIAEVNRVLKKGAIAIITVPHLSRLHEEPNDYFRFTKYGLKSLLEEVGFEVLEINPCGGIFSFLGHQFSTIFVCLFWHIPVIRKIVFFINKWFCVIPCYLLDKVFDKEKIFALGYICIAKKG